MHFTIAGREVEVAWRHVLLYAGFSLALAIIIGTAAMALSFIFIGDPFAGFIEYDTTVLSIVGIFIQPFVAFSLLFAASHLKMKADAGFCRGMAASSFLVYASIYLALLVPYSLLVGFDLGTPFGILSSLMDAAVSSMTLYLWFLIMLEKDIARLKESAGSAVFYALVSFLLIETALLIMDYSNGIARAFKAELSQFQNLAPAFIFGLGILYHTRGRKTDKEAECLFAGLYLGASFIAFLPHAPYLAETGHVGVLYNLASRVVSLALLYALGRMKGGIL